MHDQIAFAVGALVYCFVHGNVFVVFKIYQILSGVHFDGSIFVQIYFNIDCLVYFSGRHPFAEVFVLFDVGFQVFMIDERREQTFFEPSKNKK